MFHFPGRKVFVGAAIASFFVIEGLHIVAPEARWAYLITTPLIAVGLGDMFQKRHAVKRNFPILGWGRYLLEGIRPEINQYFIESDIDGRPFDRRKRSNIYQRAKKDLNATPFGTQKDLYATGTEWLTHSISPEVNLNKNPRVLIGGKTCRQPYSASIFNISAMSYGSLSKNAITALNKGAKLGDFYHNTGEGGISPYHQMYGGDLVWQIGTGYFGCRTQDGHFNPEVFAERASNESVKMIEIKLSQGAKPGKGGLLPKQKINDEVAETRGVSKEQDVVSPPSHSAFSTPKELLNFIQQLRELSGGKPIGFKLCVGYHYEFFAICKAMLDTNILPDFITVDGSEGGTGAAPLEFSDSVGIPLNEGLVFIHNALVGCNLRDKIKIIASGKITDSFHLAAKIAMGADICNSARGMMFALGCIQALQCHANTCPTGVATQDPELVAGLDVEHKSKRVANYHNGTLKNFIELLGAAGLREPSELQPWHIQRRVNATEVKSLLELYQYLNPGDLLKESPPSQYANNWQAADPESFQLKSILTS